MSYNQESYFKGIKFRGDFADLGKIAKIKSHRKIYYWVSAKLNLHEKIWKIRLIREIFKFYLNKLIQSLLDTKRRHWLISQT